MTSLNPRKFKVWRCFWLVTLLAILGVIPSTPPPGVIIPTAASSPLTPANSQQAPEEEEVKHNPLTVCDISVGGRLRAIQQLMAGFVPRRIDTNPQPGLRLDRWDRSAPLTRDTDLPPSGLRAPPALA